MSLMPYWVRHLRNIVHRDPVVRVFEDPFAVFALDPFFRDRSKYFKTFEDVYSDLEVKDDGKKVQVQLDMKNFTPDQINVKTVGNEIMVEGKMEVKKEDGWTRSHFERRFLLPEGFPPERVECHFDKGKLLLVAFRSEPINERKIEIKQKPEESAEKEDNSK